MARKRRNPRSKRELKKRILVVTEGKVTERQYIEKLVQRLRSQSIYVSIKSHGVGKDPLEVVKACIERKSEAKQTGKNYDHYVCLVDRDDHRTLNDAIALAAGNDVKFLVTNLKFEMWLLWHVEDIRSHQDSVGLDRQMKQHKLLQGKHLAPKFPIDNYPEAMKTAKHVDPQFDAGRIGPNPSSAVPYLINLLLN